MYFRLRAALIDHTVRDALSPSRTSRRWDLQLKRPAQDQDLRAALGNLQDKSLIRETYSGRSARVAMRPEN